MAKTPASNSDSASVTPGVAQQYELPFELPPSTPSSARAMSETVESAGSAGNAGNTENTESTENTGSAESTGSTENTASAEASLSVAALLEQAHPSWHAALNEGNALQRAVETVARKSVGKQVLPKPQQIFAALALPREDVKVIIVGQDPYPTPGHPIGIAFGVDRRVRPLPRSLQNIYRELHDDLGIIPPEHGDLSAWQQQGVLLLNRSFTVLAGQAGAHSNCGWEAVSDAIIATAAQQPLVGILWGRQAQQLAPLFGDRPTIQTAHPSPLSARRGFFGSKPFSRANELLKAQGCEPIQWAL